MTRSANYQIATQLRNEIARLPGAVDVFIRQDIDYPTVNVNVDRIKADEAGLTQRDVASSLLISLSSSGQVAPNQWLNPQNGVNYKRCRADATIRGDYVRRHAADADHGARRRTAHNSWTIWRRLQRTTSPGDR